MGNGSPDAASEWRPVRRPWRSSLVLICRKCRGHKGFTPKAVAKALRREAKRHGGSKAVKVVAVSCLDVCPRRATCVVVIDPDGQSHAATVSGPSGAQSLVRATVRTGAETGR